MPKNMRVLIAQTCSIVCRTLSLINFNFLNSHRLSSCARRVQSLYLFRKKILLTKCFYSPPLRVFVLGGSEGTQGIGSDPPFQRLVLPLMFRPLNGLNPPPSFFLHCAAHALIEIINNQPKFLQIFKKGRCKVLFENERAQETVKDLLAIILAFFEALFSSSKMFQTV